MCALNAEKETDAAPAATTEDKWKWISWGFSFLDFKIIIIIICKWIPHLNAVTVTVTTVTLQLSGCGVYNYIFAEPF